MKRRSACAAIGMLLCFGSILYAQRRLSTTVDRIREMRVAVVQIGFVSNAPQANPFERRAQRSGTGFFVSKQAYVLTAGHVIRLAEADAKAKGATKVDFEVGVLLDPSSNPQMHFQGSFDWTSASVVDVDDLHDLALLKLSKNPFSGEMRSGIKVGEKDLPLMVGVARLDAVLPPEGNDVLISGYPLDIPTFVTQKGMVASEGSESGDVVGICDAYEFSPLFTSKRNEVQTAPGEFLTQNAGLAIVVPIKYGIELLKKNSVSDFLTTQIRRSQKVH